MKLVVKFPSRSRPARFKQVLEGWIARAHDLSNIMWLFSFDKDDPSMAGMGEWIRGMDLAAGVKYGTSTSKVHAINRDINELDEPWDIILVISDDMVCVKEGWDKLIREDMVLYYPDGDGLLWYFDGKQMDICTLPCMGRKYYDRLGYIYHPSYTSVFCDDEQTAVARDAGKLTFFEDSIAEHRHPANFSDVKKDALYLRNETVEIWKDDQKNFEQRKANGFPQ